MKLPANLEAEVAVVGAIIAQPDALDQVADLSPDAFHDPRNRDIFGACLGLAARGAPLELAAVTDALRKLGSSADPAYVSDVLDRCVSAANVGYYAGLVRDAATLRRTITTCHEIIRQAEAEPRDVGAFMEEAERSFFGIAAPAKADAVRLGDALPEFYADIEAMRASGGALTGLPTGYYDLDQMLGGFQPSDLTILAARPGHGKSALSMNIAEHVTMKLREPVGVLYFSLEMSRRQLERRLIAGLSGVELHRLNRGSLFASDYPKIAAAGGEVQPAPLWVDDTAALTPHEMRARARRLARQKGVNLGLVIVDYLQLMRVPGAKSREQEIAEVSRSLKAMAKELQAPVLALAQLNRDVEHRNPPIPRLSDLRDSGQIEQDADVIVFIYRADAYRERREEHDGQAVLIVAKQRQGPTGAVHLRFDAARTRFQNAEAADA